MMFNRIAVGMLAAAALHAQTLNNADREKFLRDALVVATKGVNQGITNSLKATLDDGTTKHEAHVQSIDDYKTRFEGTRGNELNFRDSYKYNIAAYELSKMLNLSMVPPSVERRVGGKNAAVTWWIDDAVMTESDRRKKNLQAPDQDRWNKQAHVVRAFDQLIYNTDRNLGNLVITKDWSMWMIDHTRAFRWMKSCPELKGLKQIDRDLLASMRKLNKEEMRERLGKWLLNAEIEGILARRDQIVRHFEAQVKERGETAVLFETASR